MQNLSIIPLNQRTAFGWYDLHLPASEFRGQLGEEVGGRPGASVWQRAGVMVGQSG